MSEAMGLGGSRATTRDRSLTLFGQTMAYVAATAGFFALGAYTGRNFSESLGWVWFIAAIVCLFAMNFTARRSMPATSLLLGAFGILIGLATAPLLAYYAATDPAVLWEAGGATALFIAGFGTAGYSHTQRSHRSGPGRLLRPPGPHPLWHRADLRAHPSGDAHLRRARPGHLRRSHDVRLSAPPTLEGHRFGTADGGVDLPRHLECLPVLPPHLRLELTLRTRKSPVRREGGRCSSPGVSRGPGRRRGRTCGAVSSPDAKQPPGCARENPRGPSPRWVRSTDLLVATRTPYYPQARQVKREFLSAHGRASCGDLPLAWSTLARTQTRERITPAGPRRPWGRAHGVVPASGRHDASWLRLSSASPLSY